MKSVLIAANISNTFRDLLLSKSYELVDWDGGEVSNAVSGIVTSNRLTLGMEQLQKLPSLQWIARLGSGIEIIDTAYCKQHQIAVASSPSGIANSVGEHCLAMLIALNKNIAMAYRQVYNKQWIREPNRGWELAGKTIGLIGYGHTGQAFAKKLSGFDVEVLAFDKYRNNYTDAYATEVSLQKLQKVADVISFHVPLNVETTHYYNEQFIIDSRPHVLINAARGPVVSTAALIGGLENNKVKGAALDVLENEHLLQDEQCELWVDVKKLLDLGAIITPHIAGYSHNAIEKMSQELMEKLQTVI